MSIFHSTDFSIPSLQKINKWSREMFLRCKMDLHKLPSSEKALCLDTVVEAVICCIDLIVSTTTDDSGMTLQFLMPFVFALE